MQILNIAGYKFTVLNQLDTLRETFLEKCRSLNLMGTILLSKEGINISMAGAPREIETFKEYLESTNAFQDMRFHETYSEAQPFKRLKVKLKKEIITMNQPCVNALNTRAPSVAPETLKEWLDENRDIVVLDTRNDYEVRFGAFSKALNLHIDSFCEFPEAASKIEKDKTIVMYCTGGIRCEKAALYMMDQGYNKVYQLEGGILNYFAKVGGEHYDGDCFVFDERIAVDPALKPSGTIQCRACNGPVSPEAQSSSAYVYDVSCPTCVTHA